MLTGMFLKRQTLCHLLDETL